MMLVENRKDRNRERDDRMMDGGRKSECGSGLFNPPPVILKILNT